MIGLKQEDPGDLPAKKTEQLEEKSKKLAIFRELVGQKICQYWENSADLGSRVSRSLIKLIKTHPAVGWVRADELPSEEVNQELLRLRKRVEELERELAAAQTEAPKGAEALAHGEDKFTFIFGFEKQKDDFVYQAERHRGQFTMSWDEIFYVISPCMIDEAPQHRLAHELASDVENVSPTRIAKPTKV